MQTDRIPADASVLDASVLNRLRRSAASHSPEATRAVAQQFEGIFLGMVMKSMRDATPSEGLFNSEQEKMMTGMLDQQMAQTLAARGVGLAAVLVRQMTTQIAPSAAGQASLSTPSPTLMQTS
jgi:flagellar protein FlgJ